MLQDRDTECLARTFLLSSALRHSPLPSRRLRFLFKDWSLSVCVPERCVGDLLVYSLLIEVAYGNHIEDR